MNIEKQSFLRLILLSLLFCGLAGSTLAQGDGAYVIKKDGHYLSHAGNTLQDTEAFSPDCIWYSGTRFNPAGTNHNYYYYDGTNYRFLSAPMSANGTLSLSESLPSTSMLRNTDQIYYFYSWDSDTYGAGVSRGHQYDVDSTHCEHSWSVADQQCWEVYWIGYNSGWKLSNTSYYELPAGFAARYRGVAVTEHEKNITSGGLTALNNVPSEMDFHDNPTPTATVSDSYNYIPAYTTYVFEGGTHNYYNNTDNDTSTPSASTGVAITSKSYQWIISGEGAPYLSFDADSNQDTTDTAFPTLIYRLENTTGHKMATVTVIVTYTDENSEQTIQTLSADVLVKTPCQNPTQAAAPVINHEGAVVSWVATSDSCNVYWKKTTDGSYGTPVTVRYANSYAITGLEYETEYTYKVVAFCGGDEQVSGNPAPQEYTFTTHKEPGLLVYGAIFGGGRMADVTGRTEVVVVNCDSIGAVFGGNDIAGVVKGASGSTITLGTNSGNTDGTTTDTIKIGDVYGGGNGYYAYNGTSFEPASYNSEYDIANNASVMAMTQNHTVGEAAWTNNTGSTKHLVCPKITRTTITVTNDYIVVDSLFGGAKNAILTRSYAEDVAITINGGTIFAVYGGNNFGGSLGYHGEENILINRTKIDPNLSLNVTNTATSGFGRDFGIRYLFGGGNKVQGQHVSINMVGGQIDNLFGGGNAADVRSTNVTVNCPLEAGSDVTYGSTYSNAIDSYSAGTITVKDDYAWDGKGIYNVRNLFGGNNEATMECVPTVTLTSGSAGTVYGGGNAGDMLASTSGTVRTTTINYSTKVTLNSASMLVDYLYGGCRMSNVDYSTLVEVKNGHVGTVFGGCNVSGDVGSTRLHPEISYSVSNAADYQAVQGGTYVVATGGTVYKNVFAGSNGMYHCNDGVYYVEGINFTDENYVGMAIPTHNETHVIISKDAVADTYPTIKGNVYAGGNLANVGFDEVLGRAHPDSPQDVGLATVKMDGGWVQGNVFGGGNMADIFGSNEVLVSGDTISGALYGGNDRTGQVARYSNRVGIAEVASDNTTSVKNAHAYVKITGSPKINEVYGGGNGDYAYFSTIAEAQAYSGPKETVVSCNVYDQPIQSNTFVDVAINGGANGGEIGTVFGGGDGVTAQGFIKVLLNVQSATNNRDHVGTIFGGNNKGDLNLVSDIILLNGQVGTVYGGCNEGAMTADSTITIGGVEYRHLSSLVRLRKEYDAVKTDNTTQALAVNAKVSNAVYGGCRMNGVTHTGMVLVEGGNYSDIPLFGGSDISGNTSGTSMVVVRDDTGATYGSSPVVGYAYGGGNGNYDYTSGVYEGLTPPYSANSIAKMVSGTANYLFAGGYAGESGDTYLQVTGGTVNNVFGGGNQAGTTTDEVVTDYNGTGTSTVDINGGTVTTAVYGGCNASGDIAGPVNVNINGGTVGASGSGYAAYGVFGGGYGANTGTDDDVTVVIGNDSSLTPTVYGNVYGGSAKGNVNDAVADTTNVFLKKGTVNGDIYGGGYGDGGANALVEGTVNVVISGGTVNTNNGSGGRVFGGNNENGTPLGPITVTVNGTNPTVITSTDTTYAIQGVYGGGNLAAYVPTDNASVASVVVDSCATSIKYVYGGGNAAPVPATNVTINGGFINQAFAGGDGLSGTPAHVGYNSTADDPASSTAYGTGNARITLNGGTILRAFGGSNANGLIRSTAYVNTSNATGSCDLAVNEIYGGGNAADGNGSEINIGCFGDGSIHDVYGGAREADILSDIVLNITGGNIDRVFGGNNISGDVNGTITVNIVMDDSNCSNDNLNYVYGGGNQAAYTAPSSTPNYPAVNIKKGTVNYDVFGGGLGATATVTGNPVVTVGDISNNNNTALVNRNVYGGGSLAEVEGNPTVNIRNNHTVIAGNVFGAGLGDTSFTDEDLAKVTGTTLVHASAGLVKGNLYGGGSLGAVDGTSRVTVSGTARLGYVENEVVHGGKVFGAGLGNTDHTEFATVTHTLVTTVNAEDVQFNDNVYGGGELGVVTGNTNVVINSGSLKDVYGAGQGIANASPSADIEGNTNVTVNGGTITNLFGGGQNGTVHYAAGGAAADAVVTTVNIEGGTITRDAFGGGYQGTTQGRVVVNMDGGTVGGELYAGAYGTSGKVYVAGLKTLNMRGGVAVNHIYAGSRNANDGLDLDQLLSDSHTATDYIAFINMSGGEVRGNVYGAGYYGHLFGSSDVNFGVDAINHANPSKNIDRNVGGNHSVGYLHVFTHVYAGSNWGDYNPAAGGFGQSTTTGHSNIYVDGNGYNTQTLLTSDIGFMSIDGALYGSGTSCDAGSRGRKIQIANYGHPIVDDQMMESFATKGTLIEDVLQASTRLFESIQRCDTIIFDNSSIEFTGQGDISQNHNTAQYSLLFIDDGVWVRNGSNLVCNQQIDEIHALYSEYRPGNDLYTSPANQTAYWIGIANPNDDYSFHYLTKGDTPADQGELPEEDINTFRFSSGFAMYVRYSKLYQFVNNNDGIPLGTLVELNAPGTGISDPLLYGELNGFFRIVASEENQTFAHARPKRPNNNVHMNDGDGGFMSYFNQGHNIYLDDIGNSFTNSAQFPYTNMLGNAKADRPDYRYWQIKTTNENLVNYDAVLYVYSKPESEEEFLTVEYPIELPSLNCDGGFYELYDIDFGDNIRIVDGGICYPSDDANYYLVYDGGTSTNPGYHQQYLDHASTDTTLVKVQNHIKDKPNSRFGLVVIPDGCLTLNNDNEPWVLSNNAKPYLTPNGVTRGKRYYYPTDAQGHNNHQGKTPKLKLRITYYKELTQSVTLAPIIITMKSYCPGDVNNAVNDIRIEATITTQTALGQNVNVTAYAMYDNIATQTPDETYKLKVTLPAFVAPENSGGHETPFYIYQQEYHHINTEVTNEPKFWATSVDSLFKYHSDRNYALTYIPANNADNKNGWAHSTIYEQHELNLRDDGSCTVNPIVQWGDDAVKVGEADGRMPISIDFKLVYNSSDVLITPAYGPGEIGKVTFKVCYPVLATTLNAPVPEGIAGTTVPEGWKRFEINVTIYKKTASRGFFLDGIMGDDTNFGEYADNGLRSIQGVLDNGWTPGDHVLVVRPITVTSNTVWNNANNYTLSLYRYPGGTLNNSHVGGLYSNNDPGENNGHNAYETDDGIEYTSSVFFTLDGTSANLNLNNFILDGMYGSSYPFLKQPPTPPDTVPEPYNWDDPLHAQHLEAPLIDVIKGKATLSNCELRNTQNNSGTAMGGAVHVSEHGTLNLYSGTVISNCIVADAANEGGAIYVEDGATVNVKGLVNITGNKKMVITSTDTTITENNVYLEALSTTVTIDKNEGLDPAARIGIYKTEFYSDGDLKDLSPIATSPIDSRIKEAYINHNFIDDTRRGYIFHYYEATTLYMGKTWAHYQTVAPAGFAANDINSAEDLAWFISYVNGLNGSDPHPTADAQLTGNIPGEVLGQHFWLPIGGQTDEGETGFKGTFDGQWYRIDSLTMRREGFTDMGLFSHVTGDNVDQGVVKNVLMTSANIQPWNPEESHEQHVGGIAGRVSNHGTVTACQALPTIDASDANRSTFVGGVVGCVDTLGIVHSVIGMPSLTGYTMGGIVGKISGPGEVNTGGSLYNSYSYISSMTRKNSGNIGGLVGYNLGTVENNYTLLPASATVTDNFGWLVGRNGSTGVVNYCYAPDGVNDYVNYDEGTLAGHGNFDPDVRTRKAIGYLYDDNEVTLASGQTNPYYSENINYGSGNDHIEKWPGLVSTLDQWAKEKNTDSTDPLYGIDFARWFRPGTTRINRDLPILGMTRHQAVAAVVSDSAIYRNGLVLDYSLETTSSDKHSSLDTMLIKYNSLVDKDSHTLESAIFVYGNAIDVKQVPVARDSVFIHEDAVLKQHIASSKDATPDFVATVGVTFDNSNRQAHDYFHNQLEYDWHLMSSPLKDAPTGTFTYNESTDEWTPNYNMDPRVFQYGTPVNLLRMEDGYFPNGLSVSQNTTTDVLWDFYSYDERDYHWINHKRSSYNHWHIDTLPNGQHPIIHSITDDGTGVFDLTINAPYLNEEEYIPGKGYMMAISQDSYLSNTGLLNKGNFNITVTAMAPSAARYDRGSNLVGNPYHAYLNLDALLGHSGNSFINGAYLYLAESDTDQPVNGAYVPYSAGSSSNPATPTQYIHPHQGFFIVTNKANIEETLHFTYDMAGETNDPGSFFRGIGKPNYPLVNLYATDGTGNADLTIVEFNRPELGGVNKIDNLRNADFQLYSRMNDENYSLLFAPEGTQRVPVFFNTPKDGEYTLSWRTHNGTFTAMYLVDNRDGIRYDMLSHDHYTFNARAIDYAARFYIEFEVTDVEEYDDEHHTFAYFNGTGWVIEGSGQLELIDMLGHVLYANTLSGDQTIVHFDGIASGMYLLRLVDGSKLKAVQKIVIY